MNKKLIISLSVVAAILVVGFGLYFSSDTLVSKIGAWIGFAASILLIVLNVFNIFFEKTKNKKSKNKVQINKSEKSNDE